jgi:hypothetical protein
LYCGGFLWNDLDWILSLSHFLVFFIKSPLPLSKVIASLSRKAKQKIPEAVSFELDSSVNLPHLGFHHTFSSVAPPPCKPYIRETDPFLGLPCVCLFEKNPFLVFSILGGFLVAFSTTFVHFPPYIAQLVNNKLYLVGVPLF